MVGHVVFGQLDSHQDDLDLEVLFGGCQSEVQEKEQVQAEVQVQVVPDLLVCSLAVVLVQGLQKSCSSAGHGQAVAVGHRDPLSDQEDQQELEELHHSLLESAA